MNRKFIWSTLLSRSLLYSQLFHEIHLLLTSSALLCAKEWPKVEGNWAQLANYPQPLYLYISHGCYTTDDNYEIRGSYNVTHKHPNCASIKQRVQFSSLDDSRIGWSHSLSVSVLQSLFIAVMQSRSLSPPMPFLLFEPLVTKIATVATTDIAKTRAILLIQGTQRPCRQTWDSCLQWWYWIQYRTELNLTGGEIYNL